MTDEQSKPGSAADAKARAGSDLAQARVRAWWRRVPRLLTSPRDVFVALGDDDEIDVEARSEPILAIVILAGMAGILLTPAWGTLLDDESLDWLVLAVVTFIGALFYGTAGYFVLGFVVWVGSRGVGLDVRSRPARQLVGFCRAPVRALDRRHASRDRPRVRLRLVPQRRLRRGHGPRRRARRRPRLRALVARAARAGPAYDVRPALAGRRGRSRPRHGHRGRVRDPAVRDLGTGP